MLWDCVLGGPGAIGTTPLLDAVALTLVAVFAAVVLGAEPAVDLGDSESAPLALPEVGVVAEDCAAIEFLRDVLFFDLLEPPTGTLFPLPRLRFLMTSVLSDSGRTTPCNFKNRPHALQSG